MSFSFLYPFRILTGFNDPDTGCRFKSRSQEAQSGDGNRRTKDRFGQEFENCVETGFAIASYRGPLCAEPVQGLVYFVESIEFDEDAVMNESGECLTTDQHREGLMSKFEYCVDW